MDPRLEPHAAHADRLADAVLIVDDELLREHVDDLAVARERDRLGLLEDPLDVVCALTSRFAMAATPSWLIPRTWLPAMPA